MSFDSFGTGGVKVKWRSSTSGGDLTLSLPAPTNRALRYVPECEAFTSVRRVRNNERAGIRPNLTLTYIITDAETLEDVFAAFSIADCVVVWPYADEPLICYTMQLTENSIIEPEDPKNSSVARVVLDYEAAYLISKVPDRDNLRLCRSGKSGTRWLQMPARRKQVTSPASNVVSLC